MIFSSFQFLFLFLPLVLLFNYFLPIKSSNIFLLVVSVFFYFVGEGALTVVFISSIIWNYIIGILLDSKLNSSNHKANTILAIGVTGNLLALIYFKYFGFIIESLSLNTLMGKNDYSSIALPIGISFFTFQGISYLIDVYRKDNKAENNPIKLGLFISFFPQLIAGPIVKYHEIASQLSNRSITLDKSVEGSYKFIRGLFKKVVIANNLAIIADQIFITEINDIPSIIGWLAVITYSLQIYFDFSGYSDMAIGLCLIFGFKIPENFNYPYIAKSFKEFWQRWHISLSSWFKNYLYIPLGGNQYGTLRTYLNLSIVFFITGLWHGASFNFIIWGLFHGFFLIIERIFPVFFNKMPVFIKHTYLLLAVSVSWVFFRIESLEDATNLIVKLFSFNHHGDFSVLLLLDNYKMFLIILAVILSIPLKNHIHHALAKWSFLNKENNLWVAKCMFYTLIFIFCILELSITTHSPFIYFKF
jgi:alginate O-acetyltransferase complex protein AlgI